MSRAWMIPGIIAVAVGVPIVVIARMAGWSDAAMEAPLLILFVATGHMHAEMAQKARLAKAGRATGEAGRREGARRRW